MRMGRIGGFEECTFAGVVEVVGNRIGPLREFVLGGRGGDGFWLDGFVFGVCVIVCVCVLCVV